MPSHRLCAALSTTLTVTLFAASSFAQTDAQCSPHHRYKLVDLGSTFGGPQSGFSPGSGNDFGDFNRVINNPGIAVGNADTSEPDPFPNFCFNDCYVNQAFRSGPSGRLQDIGSLPGGGSSLPVWITDNGSIAGFSENGKTDPLYPGLPEFRATLWQDGKIKNLGTLGGGSQSEAHAANNFGQLVGASTTKVPDANSMSVGNPNFWNPLDPTYAYQVRAFLWDAESGMQDLGTLGGSDARALLINDRGQVVGHSYPGSTPSPSCNYPLTTDSFIWEKGKGMTDLGSLGGTCTVATNLNQAGQIVGASNLAGDQLQHAFFWERGKLRDLGGSLGGSFTGAFSLSETGEAAGYAYLAGDVIFHAAWWRQVGNLKDLGVVGNDQCSAVTGINSREQLVGTSVSDCTAEEPTLRAFLWEKGTMFDLNALIPANSPVYLQTVITINESGEIAGNGVDASGNGHAFVLIPCDANHPNVDGCDYSIVDTSTLQTVNPPQPRSGVSPRLPHVRFDPRAGAGNRVHKTSSDIVPERTH